MAIRLRAAFGLMLVVAVVVVIYTIAILSEGLGMYYYLFDME